MHAKKIIAGSVILLAMAGLYMAGQKSLQTRGLPKPKEEPMDLGELPGTLQACPGLANSVVMNFDGEHTDATRAAVAAYDQTIMEGKLAESEKPRLIQYVDLNNDGREDFMTLYTSTNWCGSLGCAMDIFIQAENGGYNGMTGFYTEKGKSVVLNQTVNGYRLMISPVRYDNLPGEQNLWAWTGEKYESNVHCLKEE